MEFTLSAIISTMKKLSLSLDGHTGKVGPRTQRWDHKLGHQVGLNPVNYNKAMSQTRVSVE